MKISQKGLYALQAMMMLARHHNQGAIRIRDIAYEEELPEKFLELILLELKNARIVESVRGAKGGYQLRRPPSEIYLAEIIRLIDGALAPFGDADQLRVGGSKERSPRARHRRHLGGVIAERAARVPEHRQRDEAAGHVRREKDDGERRNGDGARTAEEKKIDAATSGGRAYAK